MNILEVDELSIKESVDKYEWILLDIYEKGDFLYDLTNATMNGLLLNVSNDIKLIKIDIKSFKNACNSNLLPDIVYDGYPEILLIRNGKLNVRIPSFSRVGKIIDIIREKVSVK